MGWTSTVDDAWGIEDIRNLALAVLLDIINLLASSYRNGQVEAAGTLCLGPGRLSTFGKVHQRYRFGGRNLRI